MRALEYIKDNMSNLDESQIEEIMKLVESMSSFGLSDEAKLKSVTIGEINYIHRGEISEHGIAMLKKKFGVRGAIAPFKSGISHRVSHTLIKTLQDQRTLTALSLPSL